jgi:hypothetical protein
MNLFVWIASSETLNPSRILRSKGSPGIDGKGASGKGASGAGTGARGGLSGGGGGGGVNGSGVVGVNGVGGDVETTLRRKVLNLKPQTSNPRP